MTTELTGRYFISYRRSPARAVGTIEAERLRNALRDRGAPTWRDIDDLAAEPTEDDLVATLHDPQIAGAIMLVSPEVAASPIIKKVEAHRIFRRHAAKDGFFVKPVLINLNYNEANIALDAPAGFQDLGDWNLHKISGDTLTDDDAREIARSIVTTRLVALSADNATAPLDIGLFSRRGGGPGPFALRFDYSPYFVGRQPTEGAFGIIETALTDSASAAMAAHNNVIITGQGNASLPIGVLFGAVFSPLAGCRVSWQQAMPGHAPTYWSFEVTPVTADLKVRIVPGDPDSEDVVLALGISANTETAVTEFLNGTGLKPRASLHVSRNAGSMPQGTALTPEDGAAIVLQTVEAVRTLKDDLGLRRLRLHLFLACPLAMAVLLGQKLNTFTECVLYEHDPHADPSYLEVHRFNPSGFSYPA